jgi:hypothetical protein
MKQNCGAESKQQARIDTIIEPYRDYFKHNSLPKEKQYWTMAGQCGADDKPVEGCEPWQLITKEKFITKDQYRGVESKEEIVNSNRTAWDKLQFLHNDFYMEMAATKDFNPGIVNMDSFFTPETGCEYLGKIMLSLVHRKITDVLLVVNLVVKGRFYPLVTDEYIFEKIKDTIYFEKAWDSGLWERRDQVYHYAGWSRGNITTMATLNFVKGGSK